MSLLLLNRVLVMNTCLTKEQSQCMLQLVDVGHTFHHTKPSRQEIFKHLNLSVACGEVVCIVGSSGVGKSTLFNIAAGLIQPKQGRVLIDGIDRTGQAGHAGYMLQQDLLLPFKTIFDNIALPLRLQGEKYASIERKIMPQLALFGLQGLEYQYPHQISGGQKQRVALLRTYLSNEHLMLLDEPFSALDFVTKLKMYAWFKNFRQQLKPTCLIITHDIDEAIHLSDRIGVLKGTPAYFDSFFSVPKQETFIHSQEFLQLKQEILKAIC